MTITDGVKIKSATLVEKTKHALSFVHYFHPTRSRQDKREAIVRMKAVATEKRKAKEKAIRRDSQVDAEKRKAKKKARRDSQIDAEKRKAKEKARRRDSRNPKREPRHFHLHLNNCTCLRCFSVQ